jgi:hypothetical protein
MATAKHLDNQGEAAQKMYKKIADSSKDYNARRREQTEALRDTLTPVWEALASGKAVNGCKDKLSWCKWANPSAKNPERYFYKLMSDEGKIFSEPLQHNSLILPPRLALNRIEQFVGSFQCSNIRLRCG